MRLPRSIVLFAGLGLSACTSDITGGVAVDAAIARDAAPVGHDAPRVIFPPDASTVDADPRVAARQRARASFDTTVLPILQATCAACHIAGGTGPGFMTPNPDAYSTMMGWPDLVSLTAPADSRLLTRGMHAGPAFTMEQKRQVRAWIDLEIEATGRMVPMDPETASFMPVLGMNSVDLTSIGLSGSTLAFRAELLSVGLYLSGIELQAGPGGARVKHPLWVVWKAMGGAMPDPVDSFADVDVSVPAGMKATLGAGTLVLVRFEQGDRLSVHFESARPLMGADGGVPPDGGAGGMGGGNACRNLVSFSQYAKPPLLAECASCHAGMMPTATNNLDLRMLADMTTMAQATACAQVKARVNVGSPNASGLFLTVNPAGTSTHPFRFGGSQAMYDAFRSAMLLWIVTEQ